MKEQKLLVTMKDIQRHEVLNDVIEKKLKGVEAAQLLDLTPVHIARDVCKRDDEVDNLNDQVFRELLT